MMTDLLGRLPSGRILASALLCVVIPMLFYWGSIRFRQFEPPWKNQQTTNNPSAQQKAAEGAPPPTDS
ncbi:hypothetical protein PaecuDRAFT_4772 [Paenibacillus curdlanolyticus YK9]|uniref:Uncharacterized protein n=1 Tax=Paenibacillus curdlanolyticus YK9 TaxID=717606 RepID=E0IGH9_9BACL|nr:hypothetical protein [Paenibacillus curdlanolyticus]EFM08419.1 hypothetical protein PaecuDRAFT_4772 [Paenibacillus curdlanolyticus YK9]